MPKMEDLISYHFCPAFLYVSTENPATLRIQEKHHKGAFYVTSIPENFDSSIEKGEICPTDFAISIYLDYILRN